MSKLHLVFGGHVKDPRGLDFDMSTIDLVGIYDSYAAAEEAWRGKAQGSVDDAEMKYVVVHLHRQLEANQDPLVLSAAKRSRRAEAERFVKRPSTTLRTSGPFASMLSLPVP